MQIVFFLKVNHGSNDGAWEGVSEICQPQVPRELVRNR